MLNKVTLMGRLVADPTLRHTKSGTPVCDFTIACQRDYKSADGEAVTDFIDVVAWNNTAEFVGKHLSKGRMAIVEGRLQLRDWTGRDGIKRRTVEILANSVSFGDSRPQNQENQNTAAPAHSGSSTSQKTKFGRPGKQSSRKGGACMRL